MLQLDKHEVDVTNVNLRKEKHGSERKLGVDITVAVRAPNTMLDQVEKGLRQSLFRAARKGEQLDMVEGADDLVAVKHPMISPIRMEQKITGYELLIEHQVEGSAMDPLVLVDVTLKDITVEPIEGGSVELTLKLQAGVEPDELTEIGEYYTHTAVRMTLTAPKAEAQQPPAE